MSEIVSGFVDLAVPSLERVVSVLERAKAAPAEARVGLAAAIERAERDVMPSMQAALGQLDMFLADATAVVTRTDLGRPSPVPRKGSGGGATPVPVTRGSGAPGEGGKVVRRGVRRGAL